MLPAETSGDPTKRTRRQHDRAERVRRRARQEDQADPRVSDVDRSQLRRDPARDRLAPSSRRYSVSTPVNWKDGEDVIIAPAINDEDAKTKFPKGGRR